MKKFLVSLLLLMPITAFAFLAQWGENMIVSLPISDDLYLVGDRVEVNTVLSWDLITAGGIVIVDGTVEWDLLAAGGTVELNGSISDDARIAGGNMVIRGTIQDDLVIAWGNIEIRSGAIIGGDLVVTGGNVVIQGKVGWQLILAGGQTYLNAPVAGSANIWSERITTGPQASIGGNLQYTAAEKNQSLESVTSGTVEMKTLQTQKATQGVLAFIGAYLLYKLLFLTIFGFLLVWFFEKFFHETSEILWKRPWKSLMVGLWFFLLMPILILLSFVSIIAIPVGFLLLAAYIFAFVFYELIGVVVFASWTESHFQKGKRSSWWKKLAWVILFALIFTLISGVDIIAAWFALWALLMRKWALMQSLRK